MWAKRLIRLIKSNVVTVISRIFEVKWLIELIEVWQIWLGKQG